MQKKVLMVTRQFNDKQKDGGLIGLEEKIKYLYDIYGKENVTVFTFEKPTLITRLINFIFKQSYGQTKAKYKELKSLIKNELFDTVFFNSSIFGSYVKFCKKQKIRTVVFYHNVESEFYKERYKSTKKILDFMNYRFIKYNEAKVSRLCDKKIMLNDRDNLRLKEIYNQTGDFILPVTLPVIAKERLIKKNTDSNYCMFLGSNFYANLEGVSWFIDNILPVIDFDFHVVGSICEGLRNKYSNVPRLFLEGYVDNVDAWYNSALFIVSPIFSGSGMKTKTIEALSYGKYIFGTKEAFVGVDADLSKIGACCNSKEEFINAIKNFDMTNIFNEYSLDVFYKNFSFSENCKKLKAFLECDN